MTRGTPEDRATVATLVRPMRCDTPTADLLHILQHSLGLDQYGRGRAYRNHFVTGEGSDDFGACMSLVADGLMTRRAGSAITGWDDCFTVTDAGLAYVIKNSPPPPKLTRAQQRYERFLDADCGLTFGEWIRARSA